MNKKPIIASRLAKYVPATLENYDAVYNFADFEEMFEATENVMPYEIEEVLNEKGFGADEHRAGIDYLVRIDSSSEE